MIEFNGIKYAKNEAELTESLFQAGGTANGIYKKTKNGTKLFKPNGELFAYIVHNARQGYFVVSAFMHEGKPRYMYALTSSDKSAIGWDSVKFSEQADVIKDYLKQFAA